MSSAIPLQLLEGRALADVRGRPLHDLRISVIDRCNFRCPYCMPEREGEKLRFLPANARLDAAEIERVARVFVGLGVEKLRLTGGEPLLRKDLPEIVRRLATIPGVRDLALTTNGALLAAQARALRDAGLMRLTVSLDSLDPAVFAQMSGGRGRVDDVLAGIAAAERAGFERLKLNCVVQRGVNDTGVLALVARFRGTGHVVRFIEYMDVGTCNGWRRDNVVPSAELRERIGARWPLRALPPTNAGEVAERWAFVDGGGELGFVSSVSQPFCGDCNRARISADGVLYTCLFASAGTDLRAPLREGADDTALAAIVERTWRARGDRWSELRAAAGTAPRPRVEMYKVGG
ncbi:MAG TPA: GTP 3',8-cyclase MoaA [Xanthomonadales bacterium]|nr:GTP 3',8-cyclase MoaA [Xanthomonadales bacterium]